VQGATIVVNPGGYRGVTDANGTFIVELPVGSSYTLTVTAPRLKTQQIPVAVDTEVNIKNIELVPANEP